MAPVAAYRLANEQARRSCDCAWSTRVRFTLWQLVPTQIVDLPEISQALQGTPHWFHSTLKMMALTVTLWIASRQKVIRLLS